jgi:hypothetical protein
MNVVKKLQDLPLGVVIKNLTEDKYYNIPVFNPNYKETELKYSYGRLGSDCSNYDDTLDRFASLAGKKVAFISVAVEHGYVKYKEKQVQAGFIIDGETIPFPYHPHQIQNAVTQREISFDIYEGMEFNLPFLLPEAEVQIFIYLKP